MTVVTVQEAEADFERLVAEVEAGGKVVITVDGKPVASLVPMPPPSARPKRVFGGLTDTPEGEGL
ncbi:type II toxin-antitoxin system Phd/YefM family antitoxin [Caulobacter sp. LARHSG274]